MSETFRDAQTPRSQRRARRSLLPAAPVLRAWRKAPSEKVLKNRVPQKDGARVRHFWPLSSAYKTPVDTRYMYVHYIQYTSFSVKIFDQKCLLHSIERQKVATTRYPLFLGTRSSPRSIFCIVSLTFREVGYSITLSECIICFY